METFFQLNLPPFLLSNLVNFRVKEYERQEEEIITITLDKWIVGDKIVASSKYPILLDISSQIANNYSKNERDIDRIFVDLFNKKMPIETIPIEQLFWDGKYNNLIVKWFYN